MVLTVRIVWPEFGDELLQQLIRDHPDDDSRLWRVDVFPNFVTYRRQVDALKTVCIRGYLEPKPSDVVRRILASLVADRVERGRVERGRLEAGGRHDEPDGDQPEAGLPAAADSQPRPAAENAKAATSDFSLPSDVVTDEAPPDEEEALPVVGNIDGAGGCQQLRQKVQPKEDSADLLALIRQDRSPRKRIPSSKHLNESQRQAVETAVNEPLTVIQGPPGTGKTMTAAEIVKEWLISLDRTSTVIIKQLIFCQK